MRSLKLTAYYIGLFICGCIITASLYSGILRDNWAAAVPFIIVGVAGYIFILKKIIKEHK